jgi:GNAT superfamily N-acetyltransferase
VGLLVAKQYRRKGIARMLIDGAGRLTQALDYDELFMSTSILGEMLLREGWSDRGEVDFLNGERGRVYVRALTGRRRA